jgi:sterol-4alpha-carboxylate 3-dehydrogenase (decarboxylating)
VAVCGFCYVGLTTFFLRLAFSTRTQLALQSSTSPIMSSSATKIKSALVIGGCGSLGHHTVKQLLKLEPTPQVSVFDIQTKVNRIEGVEYYDVDITDKQQVYSALEKSRPEVIFHTASPPPALSDLPLYMRVNVDGTRNLVECAKVSGYIFSSSKL